MSERPDLIAIIEHDLGPGKASGRWTMFKCPFHRDLKPSFAVTNGDTTRGPHWQCFACGKRGGPMAWFMKYHNMSIEEAREALYQDYSPALSHNRPKIPEAMPIENPPGEQWQARARELTERAEENLWSNKGDHAIDWAETDPETGKPTITRLTPLEWLLSRGLNARTLKTWHIGYIPLRWKDSPEHWGTEAEHVYIPKGILIPGLIGKHIWYLKIRQPDRSPKYLQIPGSKPALYMAEELEYQDTAVFCEGEFDALLLWQEAGFFCGPITLGSATNELNVSTWGFRMLYIKHWLTAYDMDKAGEEGVKKLDWLHTHRLEIPRLKPHDKDLTDFHKHGGNLGDWLQSELKRLKIG